MEAHSMTRRSDDGINRPSDPNRPSKPSGPPEHPFLQPPDAFTRELFAELRRRDHHPATPEADFAGPWRVTRLHGAPAPAPEETPADGVRWACFGAGEPGPALTYQAPDLAFLGAAGLALAERPPRFRFQRGADGRVHLMHDGCPVAVVAPSVPEGSSLPTDLTRLADLRVQPQALAHFLMAVPEEVLERAGVLVMRMLREVER
jgi:hypothetical protein